MATSSSSTTAQRQCLSGVISHGQHQVYLLASRGPYHQRTWPSCRSMQHPLCLDLSPPPPSRLLDPSLINTWRRALRVLAPVFLPLWPPLPVVLPPPLPTAPGLFILRRGLREVGMRCPQRFHLFAITAPHPLWASLPSDVPSLLLAVRTPTVTKTPP
jgi:hypothetical protein